MSPSIVLFFNILAWVFLVLSIARLWFVSYYAFFGEYSALIKMAEVCGSNPVGRPLIKPFLVFVVSASWLISRLFT